VICHGFSWFSKVLGAQAGPAGPEPPEAGRAAPEQSRREDLEDLFRIFEDSGGFIKNFREFWRISIGFSCFFEESQGWESFFEEFQGWEKFSDWLASPQTIEPHWISSIFLVHLIGSTRGLQVWEPMVSYQISAKKR